MNNMEISSAPENEGCNERMIERLAQIVKAGICDVRGISIHPLNPEDIIDKKVNEKCGPRSVLEKFFPIQGI